MLPQLGLLRSSQIRPHREVDALEPQGLMLVITFVPVTNLSSRPSVHADHSPRGHVSLPLYYLLQINYLPFSAL